LFTRQAGEANRAKKVELQARSLESNGVFTAEEQKVPEQRRAVNARMPPRYACRPGAIGAGGLSRAKALCGRWR